MSPQTDKKRIAADKKAAVLSSPKRKGLYLALASAAAVLIVGLSLITIKPAPRTRPAAAPAASGPKQSEDEVSYAVKLFEDGLARHFEHRLRDDLSVRYFIIKSSDGVIRAAFDACDVCWPSGRGYIQSGDDMVCRNCGRRFASVLVNEVQGGCNPAPLKRVVRGDRVVLKTSDILAGGRYFDFVPRNRGGQG